MHLRVQLGARLDMEIGEEVEERWERPGIANPKNYRVTLWRTELKWRTQYERALQLAEDRKKYASKAIVENIGIQLEIHIDDNFLKIANSALWLLSELDHIYSHRKFATDSGKLLVWLLPPRLMGIRRSNSLR
jgi:hypothetical protein